MVFQIFAEIGMTQNENRLFGRHFETVQMFLFLFLFLFFFFFFCCCWNMVVIGVYICGVEIIQIFRWESYFLKGFYGTLYGLTEARGTLCRVNTFWIPLH